MTVKIGLPDFGEILWRGGYRIDVHTICRPMIVLPDLVRKHTALFIQERLTPSGETVQDNAFVLLTKQKMEEVIGLMKRSDWLGLSGTLAKTPRKIGIKYWRPVEGRIWLP